MLIRVYLIDILEKFKDVLYIILWKRIIQDTLNSVKSKCKQFV